MKRRRGVAVTRAREGERAWQRKGERAGFRYAVGEESLPEERRGEQRKEKRSRTEGGDDLTERKRSSKTSTWTWIYRTRT